MTVKEHLNAAAWLASSQIAGPSLIDDDSGGNATRLSRTTCLLQGRVSPCIVQHVLMRSPRQLEVGMRSLKVMVAFSIGVWIMFAAVNTAILVAEQDGSAKIALLDDCDPRIGAGWNTATNSTGCVREEGSVSRAEFGAFLTSPLSLSVVGHPAWTIAPTFVTPELGDRLRVRNAGGRGHTFTEVANFGGGFVAALNQGLAPAPECAAAAGSIIAPGGRVDVKGLALGNHKFQCCIHPWMRADVKVLPEEE
jgi:hypothetical protein